MNSINLTGRLVSDPELLELPGGDALCRLRLAVDGMAPQRGTGYIDVTSFGKSAAAAARTLSQGWLVAVEGRLEHQTWENGDGAKRSAHSIIGHVEFLSAPKNGNDDPDANIAF